MVSLSGKIMNIPLLIDPVTVPGHKGVIGITSCPGMKDQASCFDLYGESLVDDLLTIRNWGAAALVTLIDDLEFKILGVREFPATVASLNLPWFHLPIRNLGIPDESFDRQWQGAGPLLCKLLREGERVVVHCKEGIGRAGIIAARLLIEMGTPAEKAISLVQRARPGSLQLYSHERYCLSFESRLQSAASAAEL